MNASCTACALLVHTPAAGGMKDTVVSPGCRPEALAVNSTTSALFDLTISSAVPRICRDSIRDDEFLSTRTLTGASRAVLLRSSNTRTISVRTGAAAEPSFTLTARRAGLPGANSSERVTEASPTVNVTSVAAATWLWITTSPRHPDHATERCDGNATPVVPMDKTGKLAHEAGEASRPRLSSAATLTSAPPPTTSARSGCRTAIRTAAPPPPRKPLGSGS
mmetsp:Transcript_48043/g.108869  ORF Transcript_48043/g.108869 Transcript_48043/m.108869 type:complete len:221 (-) Transcript_48043:248-910(-)